MNLPIILFVFIGVLFCAYDDSCGISDKDITLSPDSEQELQQYTGDPSDLRGVFLHRKRKYYPLIEGANQHVADVNQKLLAAQFLCGINTARAEINLVMDRRNIFEDVLIKSHDEKELWKTLYMPTKISDIMLEYDGVSDRDMESHQRNFRNFYYRLKDKDYDNVDCDFMVKLRELIGQEYGTENIDSTYLRFSATIVRDYAFFCSTHHDDEISKVLTSLARTKNDDVLYHLFEINKGWFLSSEHIKNINILRKAFHGPDIPEIKGYVCHNKNNVEIQLPLFDRCGRIIPSTSP